MCYVRCSWSWSRMVNWSDFGVVMIHKSGTECIIVGCVLFIRCAIWKHLLSVFAPNIDRVPWWFEACSNVYWNYGIFSWIKIIMERISVCNAFKKNVKSTVKSYWSVEFYTTVTLYALIKITRNFHFISFLTNIMKHYKKFVSLMNFYIWINVKHYGVEAFKMKRKINKYIY